ncbi:MAG: hypothetical protein Q9163_003211 [Psora crenata]
MSVTHTSRHAPNMLDAQQVNDLRRVYEHATNVLQEDPSTLRTLPYVVQVRDAERKLLADLPEEGKGIEPTTSHLLNEITPGLNASSLSANYYGFVTGGVTPAARIADGLVTLYDQNPQVHLPDQTVASTIDDRALRLLMQLLGFQPETWCGVSTTGATASNVHGLLLGREYVISQAVRRHFCGRESLVDVGAHGLLGACRAAGLESIDVYTTMPHSSLLKAASIAGIGRCNVHDLASCKENLLFDLKDLAYTLEAKQRTSAAIIVISCGEVNTGMFGTDGYENVLALRNLCDRYGAWLHVDGAFGIFARLLEGLTEFEVILRGVEGLELADSIAGDGHKLLNVPYDCGFIFYRHLHLALKVFKNANAAYLNPGEMLSQLTPSPLNMGIENSRRFRGLPIYATLMAYGRKGYQEMLLRQVRFARAVAVHIHDHDAFELLPSSEQVDSEEVVKKIFIIVLFRAKDRGLNATLTSRINRTSKMYVSGTLWDSEPASRIAVANWQVEIERNIRVVQEVLESVVEQWSAECNAN